MESDIYTLKKPVPLADGTSLTSIRFRAPKAKDLAVIERAAKDGLVAAQIATLAALGGLAVDVVGDLEIEDFEEASRFAGGFFPDRNLSPPAESGA